MTKIHLKACKGSEILPYIDQISAFRIKYFKEFPYLYSGSLKYEREYMKGYSKQNQSLLITLENVKGDLLGFSTGMPLHAESDVVREAYRELSKIHLQPNQIFYFGETILIPEERGKGWYRKMVCLREGESLNMGYSTCSFMTVEREQNHPLRPKGYRDPEPIFRKMGYQKTSLILPFSYPTFGSDGKVTEKENYMAYWLKHLKTKGE